MSCRETQSLKLAKLRGCTFVNQYVVIKYLGRGACGRVFLCMDMEDNRLYAVKVRPQLAAWRFGRGICRLLVWPECSQVVWGDDEVWHSSLLLDSSGVSAATTSGRQTCWAWPERCVPHDCWASLWLLFSRLVSGG